MTREEVVKRIISDDIYGLICAFQSCDSKVLPDFILGGILYYSTVMFNGYEWCKRAKMDVDIFLNMDIWEKLRAKTKLYCSDNAIPLAEQKENIKEIIKTEKKFWIEESGHKIKWIPKSFIPNMGLYKLNGHYIGNTMEYAYEFSPFNQQKMPIIKIKDHLTECCEELGEYLGYLYINITNNVTSIATKSDIYFDIKNIDLNMSVKKFFKKENAIFALNLLCRINYLLELFIPLCNENPFLAFRMLYITFYHLKSDLEELELNFIHYEMPYRDDKFRNAMAHYSLYCKLDDSEIRENVIGFGLFERFFKESFYTVNEKMICEFKKTRDSFEEYVKL